MNSRAPWLAGLAAFVHLAAFFAREALLSDRGFFLRDLHLQWFGQVESFVRAVAAGSWPVWDPYVSFGQPMLANANVQVLYPPTWLNLVMRPHTYYALYFISHLVFGAAGAAAVSRRWGASEGAAVVAGAGWMASGPFLSLGNLWNHLAGAAWMPWAMLAADHVLGGSRRGIVGWALATAAPILGGSPDLALLGLVPVAALLCHRLEWRRPAAAENRRALSAAAVALALGAGLAAAQLLPSLELASRSMRWTMDLRSRTFWSVHPALLGQMLLPMTWDALPWSGSARELLFQSREPYLLSLYMGLPLLTLAGAGLTAGSLRYRAALGVSVAVCVLLALGSHSPAFSLATGVCPPLRAVRFPAKALVPAALCLSLLAGFGYDRWRAQLTGRLVGVRSVLGLATGLALSAFLTCSWWPQAVAASLLARGAGHAALAPAQNAAIRLAGLGAVLLALAWVAGWSPRAARVSAAALAGLALADLAVFHARLNPTAPADLFRWRPDALKAVEQTDGRRLFVYDYQVQPEASLSHLGRASPYAVRAVGPTPELWHGALAMRAYPVPPVAAAYGIFDSFGRDLLAVQPRPLARLNATLFAHDGTPVFRRLLELGAVRHVLALHDRGLEELHALRRWRGPFFEDIRLFQVPEPLPRAFVVGEGRLGGIEELLDAGFDPRRSVVLSDPPLPVTNASATGTVRVDDLAADRVSLEVTASGPALLVLVDTYDPGWRATLDGTPARVLRANVAFRAVAVPAGAHRVEMVYRPTSLWAGLGLSAVAALVAGVLGWRRGAPDG